MGFFDRDKKNAEGVEWRNGVYLTTVGDSFEAEIIESKLRSENIPCVKRYSGAGNFMEIAMGSNTTHDIEIYVPADLLEAAKEVIVPVPIEDDFEEEEE